MCMIDDCEPAQWYSVGKRKARKGHECSECGRWIALGEEYEYAVGKWDGVVFQMKTCAHCIVARKWLYKVCDGFVYTQVHQELIDHWDENLEYRSFWLGRAILGMRRQWKRSDDHLLPVLGPLPVRLNELA